MIFSRLPYLLLVLSLTACGDTAPNGEGPPREATPLEVAASTHAAADSSSEPPVNSEPPPAAPAAPEEEVGESGDYALGEAWTGDLDTMEQRRVVRILTVYGVGRYYLDGATEKGLTKEISNRFENFINKRLDRSHVRVHVVIIPVARNQLIPALLEGRGDIINAGLTITPERKTLVRFSMAASKPLSEILVTGPSAPELKSIDDLSGQTLYLRHSSSYRESVEELNRRFLGEGRAPVTIEPVSELLEDDDLIEMVNSGLLPWAIVDDYKPQLWAKVFTELVVRDDIVFRSGSRLAWAFRQDSPLLERTVNDFLKENREGTLIGNVLKNRYIRDFDWAANALAERDYSRFQKLRDIFRKYGEQYGIDYLIVAAQGYQESRLDQSARSQAGAIGIMQLLPSTAADTKVGIPNIEEIEPNIHAGIKYLDYLRNRYFSDPEIDQLNRTLLALGAYNAGPRRMIILRNKAQQLGYNPNIWFDNVELVAAKEIGRETVQYVANIFKYYLAYRLSAQQQLRRQAARERAGI